MLGALCGALVALGAASPALAGDGPVVSIADGAVLEGPPDEASSPQAQPASLTVVIDAQGPPVTVTLDSGIGTEVTTYSRWGDQVSVTAPPTDRLVSP